MPLPRSVLLFHESFRSEQTKHLYLYYLKKFLIWAKKDAESFLLLTSQELDVLLQDYLFYLKKRMNPNSLKPLFAAIDKFLVLNDKTYNKKKLKMLFPETIKPANERAYTTGEIRQLLEFSDAPRVKAAIHVMAASGCRVGALVDLQMKDISQMQDGCIALTFYSGSKWEYISFVHSEGAKALNAYFEYRRQDGEKLTPESFVFAPMRFFQRAKSSDQVTVAALASQIGNIVSKAKIKRVRRGTRFDLARDTAFRKRFNSILKSNPDISYAIAERLMDHRTNLEAHYLDTPKEKLFLEYRKAIPELVITESEKQKLIISQQNQKISKLEAKDLEIEKLKTRLDCIERLSEIVSVSKNS